jgi:hypothetical protein
MGDPHCCHQALTGGNTSIKIKWSMILEIIFNSIETNMPAVREIL